MHQDSAPDSAHTVMPPPASYSKVAQGPLGKGDVRMDSHLWDIPVKGLTQNPPTGVNEHHAFAAQHRACMVFGAAPADRKDTITVGEANELSHQRPPVFDEPTRQSAHHLRILLRHLFKSVMPGWSKDDIRTFYMKRAAYDYPFRTHLGAPADYAKTHGDFARRNSSDDQSFTTVRKRRFRGKRRSSDASATSASESEDGRRNSRSNQGSTSKRNHTSTSDHSASSAGRGRERNNRGRGHGRGCARARDYSSTGTDHTDRKPDGDRGSKQGKPPRGTRGAAKGSVRPDTGAQAAPQHTDDPTPTN